jgi:hypothetical protein
VIVLKEVLPAASVAANASWFSPEAENWTSCSADAAKVTGCVLQRTAGVSISVAGIQLSPPLFENWAVTEADVRPSTASWTVISAAAEETLSCVVGPAQAAPSADT